jgi:hypothetical protein
MVKGIWTIHEAPLQADEFGFHVAVGPDDRVWLLTIEILRKCHKEYEEHSTDLRRLLVLDNGEWTREFDLRVLNLPLYYSTFSDMVCGSQGELWLFVGMDTLFRIHEDNIQTFSPDTAPLLKPAINARLAADSNGGIWIALQQHGAVGYRDGKWQVYNSENSPLDGYVTCIAIDSSGIVWFALDNRTEVQLRTFDAQTWHLHSTFAKLKRNAEIHSIKVDTQGVVWAAWQFDMERHGLWRIDPDGANYTQFMKNNSQLPTTDIRSLALDHHNRCWADANGGITVFDADKSATWITIEPGVLAEPTSRSVARHKTLHINQHLMTYIYVPRIDSQGRIWARTQRGVAVFTPQRI